MITARNSLNLIAVILTVTTLAVPAHAEDTSLTQKILPLDCVFQIINDGTGTIYYVTPKACGVVVPTPPTDHTKPDNPPVSIPIVTLVTKAKTSGFITLTSNSNPILPIAVSSTSQPTYSLMWQPLVSSTNKPSVTQTSQALEQNTQKSNTTAAIAISAAAILFLVVIVIL